MDHKGKYALNFDTLLKKKYLSNQINKNRVNIYFNEY